MAWIRLVDNNIQSFVIGPVDQLQALISVSVNDNWHIRDEHEYCWHRHTAVVAVAQNHEHLLLCRLADFPFVLRRRNSQNVYFSGQSCLRGLEPYYFLIGLSFWHTELRRKSYSRGLAGGAAEAAIDGVNRTIHSVTDAGVVLIADLFPGGEMAE